MGKVKGQCDFRRMTRGRLSSAELMSCQCAAKGGASRRRAPRPRTGPRAAPALGLEVRESRAQAGDPEGSGRHPTPGPASEEALLSLQSHTKLALLLFLDPEPLPQGLPLQGPFRGNLCFSRSEMSHPAFSDCRPQLHSGRHGEEPQRRAAGPDRRAAQSACLLSTGEGHLLLP